MTVFGKILVILHFILSLVAAALFVMVYAVHTNWKIAYDDLKKQYDAAAAQATASSQQVAEAQRKSGEDVRVIQEQLIAKENELGAQKKETEAKNSELTKTTVTLAAANRTIESNAAQKKAQAEEVRRLEIVVINKDTTIKQQAETMNDLRKEKVNSDIQAAAFKDMSAGLETRVRELEETVKKARQTGVVSTGTSGSDNPPPEDVQGVVKKNADPTGLVLISVGTDAGVKKGNTLEVFRLGSTLATTKYLGRIRIIEARPYEAVGQVISKANGPILEGDRVESKIVK